MAQVIRRTNWSEARLDGQRFSPAAEQPGLERWGRESFLYQLDHVRRTLAGPH